MEGKKFGWLMGKAIDIAIRNAQHINSPVTETEIEITYNWLKKYIEKKERE